MKKALIIGLLALTTFSIAGFNSFQDKESEFIKPMGKAKVNFMAKNIDDLTNNSQVILEAVVKDKIKSINYVDVDFVETALNVNKIYKGAEFVTGKEILLLQTMIEQDPLVVKGERVLLFLDKYSGPVTSDSTFVTKGLYQGHYKLSNNILVPSAPLTGLLAEDFNQNKSYDKMQTKILK